MTYSSDMQRIADHIPKETVDLAMPGPDRGLQNMFVGWSGMKMINEWAERMLTVGLDKELGSKYDIAGYVDRDWTGPEYREFGGLQERLKESCKENLGRTDALVRRPDILLFQKGVTDMAGIDSQKALTAYNECAGFGTAKCGMDVIAGNSAAKDGRKGHHSAQSHPNFVLRLHGIQMAMNWIAASDVPHYYVQAYYDEIHMIPLKKVLEIVRDHTEYDTSCTIKTAETSVLTMILIDLEQGKKIGDIDLPPKLHETESLMYHLLVRDHAKTNRDAVRIDAQSVISMIGE